MSKAKVSVVMCMVVFFATSVSAAIFTENYQGSFPTSSEAYQNGVKLSPSGMKFSRISTVGGKYIFVNWTTSGPGTLTAFVDYTSGGLAGTAQFAEYVDSRMAYLDAFISSRSTNAGVWSQPNSQGPTQTQDWYLYQAGNNAFNYAGATYNVAAAIEAKTDNLRFHNNTSVLATVGTNNDKTGYSLLTPPLAASVFNTWTGVHSTQFGRLDATVSSRSTLAAADVWNYATRTLTSFGTLVSDTANAVWTAVTRTITGGTITSTPNDANITAIKTQTDNLRFHNGTTVKAYAYAYNEIGGGGGTAYVNWTSGGDYFSGRFGAGPWGCQSGTYNILPIQGSVANYGPAQTGQPISMRHLNTITISYVITSGPSAAPFDLTGYTVEWSAKRRSSDTAFIVPVTDITANVTVPATLGQGQIPITSAISALLTPGQYNIDVDLIKAGTRFTAWSCTLTVYEVNNH